MRQATITEQFLPEQETMRVLGARGRNRRDRLLAWVDLTDGRLSDGWRGRVEADDDQQETRGDGPTHSGRHRRYRRIGRVE